MALLMSATTSQLRNAASVRNDGHRSNAALRAQERAAGMHCLQSSSTTLYLVWMLLSDTSRQPHTLWLLMHFPLQLSTSHALPGPAVLTPDAEVQQT
jgi:hypothetical protein